MGGLEGAGAREASPDERFKVIRELGSHKTPTFAAHMRDAAGGGERLVVVERFARITLGDAPIEPVVAAARVIAGLQHTNLAQVREFVVGRDVITTATDFIDGELLSEMFDEGANIPLAVALRVLTDVCTALTVLHAMRGPGGASMPTAHGEVVASNVVVGVDGVARLLRACRPRALGSALPNDFAGLAPEVLEGRPADARSDVYSVAALLWQALSGEALFDGADPQSIVECVRSGDVPRARVPAEEAWASPLVDVVARALVASPDKRPSSAGMIAGEIRRIAGPKLATVSRVAAFVKGAAGGKIAVRRALLESGAPGSVIPPRQKGATAPPPQRAEAPPPSSSGTAIALDDDDVEPMSVRPAPQMMRAPPPKPMHLPSRTPTMRPVPAAKPVEDWGAPPPSSAAALLLDSDPEPQTLRNQSAPPLPRPRLPSNAEPTPPPSRITPLAPPLHLAAPKQAPNPVPPGAPPHAPPVRVAPGKPPPPMQSRVATLVMSSAPPPPTINPMVEPEPPPPPAPVEATQLAFSRADAPPAPRPKPPSRAPDPSPVIALPPSRPPMATEPSIIMLDKARSARRRMAIAVTSVVVAVAAGIVVWRVVPHDTAEAGPPATTKAVETKPSPPATTPAPAATTAAPPDTATAPLVAAPATTTAPPVDTGTAVAAPTDTGAPTMPTAQPTPTTTSTVVATSTATAPVPATTTAPPATTVAAPPPTTATAAPPKPPPPKPASTFDPTRI